MLTCMHNLTALLLFLGSKLRVNIRKSDVQFHRLFTVAGPGGTIYKTGMRAFQDIAFACAPCALSV